MASGGPNSCTRQAFINEAAEFCNASRINALVVIARFLGPSEAAVSSHFRLHLNRSASHRALT
jgi:hypothetical protein